MDLGWPLVLIDESEISADIKDLIEGRTDRLSKRANESLRVIRN